MRLYKYYVNITYVTCKKKKSNSEHSFELLNTAFLLKPENWHWRILNVWGGGFVQESGHRTSRWAKIQRSSGWAWSCANISWTTRDSGKGKPRSTYFHLEPFANVRKPVIPYRFIPDVELKSSETVTDATINTAVGRVHRTVYSHSQFRHRPGILDVNLELSEDQSRTAGHVRLGTNVSAVCGRRFGNVGLLAGFDLTIDNVKHVDWNCCRQTVSMAVALPTWAVRFTL